jgi:hypothetical protein
MNVELKVALLRTVWLTSASIAPAENRREPTIEISAGASRSKSARARDA